MTRIDTSPKRLRELADRELRKWMAISEVSNVLLALAAEKENPGPVCPTCGSDCNERDELEKAEREIERLRGLLAEKAPEMVKPADVPLPDGAFLYRGELVNFDDHQLNRELRGVLREAKEAHKPYMHEDELPASISDAEYAEWFKKSWILFGVRVGPVFPARPADVPLPEVTEEDRQFLHDNPNTDDVIQFVRQYGQACAKAARDAAFEECAKLLLGLHFDAPGLTGTAQEPYYDGWMSALDVAAARIRAAKRGAP